MRFFQATTQEETCRRIFLSNACTSGPVVVLAGARAYPHKNLEGNGIVPVGGIQRGGLGIEGRVRSQSQLPEPGLHKVARTPHGICPHAKARMGWVVWEEFVFIHQ